MPRNKQDLEIMGVLSWSSDQPDSEEDEIFKETRLNFLVDMNHYITRKDVHFDEKERMRKELLKQQQSKEAQMKRKLEELEGMIKQTELENKRKEMEQKEKNQFDY